MNSNPFAQFKVYLVFQQLEYGVLLPIDINFGNLCLYVKKKFRLVGDNQLFLSYNVGDNILHLIDDSDVRFFINEVNESRDQFKKMYVKVVEPLTQVHPSSSEPVGFDLNDVPVSDVDIKNKKWDTNLVTFVKEFRFDDKAALVYAVGLTAIREGFQFRVVKSCQNRYAVECAELECFWYVFARKVKDTPVFRITQVNNKHTCLKRQLYPRHRNASAKLVGQMLMPRIKDVRRVYKSKDIITDFGLDWNINVGYKKAWRGKQQALAATHGCPIASFAKLPLYFHNLKLANEGTVTHIDTDVHGKFKMCFVAFGIALKSFLCYMRPILIIDGAHLKGTYKGTNLVVVGMDGNNQIIPIATGVSQGETAPSWSWFLSKLKECIGEVPNLAIISDRHCAITHACKTVFPNAFHGMCCRHLMMNCEMQSDKLKGLYWKTCKAYTSEELTTLLAQIQSVKPEAHRKMVAAGVNNWSRALCPAQRYNYMTSNSVESVNALTKDVRKVPITSLMEWFRQKVQTWYCERRFKHADAKDDDLTPWAASKVRYRQLKSATWYVDAIHKYKEYQVRDTKRVHVVNLLVRECTCCKWQLSGIPCGHVCAVARYEGLDSLSQLAKPWFLIKTVKDTYASKLYPVKEESDWTIPQDVQTVLAPVMERKLPGRPKNNERIKSQGESPISTRCGRCGVNGHKRTACHVPLPQYENTLKRGKSSKTDGESSRANDNMYTQSQAHTQHGGNENTMNVPQQEWHNLEDMYRPQQYSAEQERVNYEPLHAPATQPVENMSQWFGPHNFLT